jgi:hypothetical protein
LGWILLLSAQDILIVLREKGGLSLVAAVPDGYREIAHMTVFTGRIWNHPIAAGRFFVARNSEEMAVYRLPAEEDIRDISK